MTCVNPVNQPIYDALLDKADSYPAEEPYRKQAYLNAAQIVAGYPNSIYKESDLGENYDYKGVLRHNYYWDTNCKIPGIGYKIEGFVSLVIRENPTAYINYKSHRVAAEPKVVAKPEPKSKPESCVPRRSLRLARKEFLKAIAPITPIAV